MSDKTLISRFLDTVGDGSGTKNVNGDYSGAQQIFKIEPPAGELYTLARMIVHIEDSGPITAAAYGALSALGNGIQLRKQDDSGTVIDLTDGVPVLSNLHWARFCYDVAEHSFGSGNNYVNVRWTFEKSGTPITLNGDKNERLEALFNDSLTGLVSHFFMVQGYTQDIY